MATSIKNVRNWWVNARGTGSKDVSFGPKGRGNALELIVRVRENGEPTPAVTVRVREINDDTIETEVIVHTEQGDQIIRTQSIR